MKKSLIALAVAGAMTVPAIASADATLYGSFRMVGEKTDNKSALLTDNATRIGIRGTVDLGLEGTRGIYNWESQINTNSEGNGLGALRYASMGATGDWGTALAGRIDHFTWSYAGGVTDLFASGYGKILSVDYVGSGVQRIDRRTNNTLAYVSPNMNGLSFGAGVVMAGDTGTEKDRNADGYNLGVNYSVAGLTLGAGYGAVKLTKVNSEYVTNENLWSLSAKYNIDAFTLAAVYEQSKDKTGVTSEKDKGYSLAAQYEVDGLGGTLAFSRAKVDNEDAGKVWQAEVYNKMGRGVVAAGYVDRNKGAIARGQADDTFYVAYRLDF